MSWIAKADEEIESMSVFSGALQETIKGLVDRYETKRSSIERVKLWAEQWIKDHPTSATSGSEDDS